MLRYLRLMLVLGSLYKVGHSLLGESNVYLGNVYKLTRPFHRVLNKHRAFVPLKDAHGTTQLLIDAEKYPQLAGLPDLPPESVIHVEGTVVARPEAQRRPVRDCFGAYPGVHPEIDIDLRSQPATLRWL